MYSGTTLLTKGTIEEINRALLDLLKKINELSESIIKIESRIKKLESQNN